MRWRARCPVQVLHNGIWAGALPVGCLVLSKMRDLAIFWARGIASSQLALLYVEWRVIRWWRCARDNGLPNVAEPRCPLEGVYVG